MTSNSIVQNELNAHRPTWAEIDLDALASNFHFVRDMVGAQVKLICVVKADAYGHGAVACSRRLEREGARWFAVALPEEAFELREAGIKGRVLSLGSCWEGQEARLIRERVTPVVCRLDVARRLSDAARAAGETFDVHVEIDTGMNRNGVRWDEAGEFARALKHFPNLRVEGLMTHFALADDPAEREFTETQIKLYEAAAVAFRAHGHQPNVADLANSAASFAFSAARVRFIRPGGALYGLWRDVLQPQDVEPKLAPVMNLRTRTALLKTIRAGETVGYGRTFRAARETRVATLPVGYADGIPRLLSNRGRVIIRGQYAPIIGRISMDYTLVDVTDVRGVEPDDVVTLIGRDGDAQITAEEVAQHAETISYEITCGVGARVQRMSLENGRLHASDS